MTTKRESNKDKKVKQRVKPWLWWTLAGVFALFIIASVIGGEVLDWYETVPGFDKVLHTISGAYFAVVGLALGYKVARAKPFYIALFAFCFAVTVGVLWEFIEFAADSWFGFNMLRWRDYSNNKFGSALTDTLWDMILATIAAFIVCVMGYFYLRRRSKKSGQNEQNR